MTAIKSRGAREGQTTRPQSGGSRARGHGWIRVSARKPFRALRRRVVVFIAVGWRRVVVLVAAAAATVSARTPLHVSDDKPLHTRTSVSIMVVRPWHHTQYLARPPHVLAAAQVRAPLP
jgi:hypothetical protein